MDPTKTVYITKSNKKNLEKKRKQKNQGINAEIPGENKNVKDKNNHLLSRLFPLREFRG